MNTNFDDNGYKSIIMKAPIAYALHKIIVDKQGNPINYEFIEVNPAFERITGLKAKNIIGKSVLQILPDIRKGKFDWVHHYGKIALYGGESEIEQYSETLKRWYKVQAWSEKKNYFSTVFTDITEQKIISETASIFNKFTAQTIDLQFVVDKAVEISGADYAVLNKFDENGRSFRTIAISGFYEQLEDITSFLGFNPLDKNWEYNPDRQNKIDKQKTTIFNNLKDLNDTILPNEMTENICQSFNIGQTVIVKTSRENVMIGDYTLFFEKGKELINQEILEAYADLSGMLLSRIDDEQRSSKALKKLTEEENKTIFQSALLHAHQEVTPDGIIIVNEDDKITFFNQRFADIWGIPDSIMSLQSGEKALEYVLPQLKNPEEFSRKIHYLQKQKQEKSYDEIILTDGTILEQYSSPIFGKNNEYLGRVWHYRDISDRKKGEEELQLQSEILDQIGDFVTVTDLDGTIIFANQAECNSIGLSKEQVIGKSIDIFGESKSEGSSQNEILETTLKEGKWKGEVVNYDKEGNLTKTLHSRTWLLLDSNKKPKGIIGVSTDITKQKLTEKALREREDHYRSIIELIPDIIIQTNSKGEYLSIHADSEDMLFLPKEEIVGKKVTETLPEGVALNILECIESALKTRERQTVEYELSVPAGKEFFEARIVPIDQENVFALIRNMTEIKEAENSLIKNEMRLQSQISILQYQADSIQDFLDYALNEAIKLTESKIGYIYFYNEQTKEFELNSWSKGVMKLCTITEPRTTYQLEKTGIWGEAVRQRKEIIVNEFTDDNPLIKGYPEGHAPLKKFVTNQSQSY